jgi:ADP-ribose pyrophosphatase YjhB (NUDIX family)
MDGFLSCFMIDLADEVRPMKKQEAPNPCPHCGRYKNRAVTVDAVVLDGGRVLLIRRANEPYKDFWALPGGYMDFDETAGEACLRELAEETGIKAGGVFFIGEFSQPGRHPEQCVSLAFLIREWTGTPAAADDAAAARWFPLSNLPSNLAFDHSKIIECAAAYKT